jgi:type VI secretion system protein VasG
MFGESQVRSGHLLVGMLKTANLRNALYAMSRQFEKRQGGGPVRPLCASC